MQILVNEPNNQTVYHEYSACTVILNKRNKHNPLVLFFLWRTYFYAYTTVLNASQLVVKQLILKWWVALFIFVLIKKFYIFLSTFLCVCVWGINQLHYERCLKLFYKAPEIKQCNNYSLISEKKTMGIRLWNYCFTFCCYLDQNLVRQQFPQECPDLSLGPLPALLGKSRDSQVGQEL